MVDLTLHCPILNGGRDDFAMLNRNALAANLIQIRPPTFLPSAVARGRRAPIMESLRFG